MQNKRVAVVTGGSNGIGRATAQRLAQRGFVVYELSRSGANSDGIWHLHADVTDAQSVRDALQAIQQREGRIDVIINNAGFGISGATEFTPITDAKRLFDVNFFGVAAVMQAGMPMLRQSRGRIVNVSSVAGAVPIPFQSYYAASKAAVLSLSEAVRNEVRMFGVSVCCVLPGDVHTGFTAARAKETLGDDLYQGKIERSVSTMERDEQNGIAPEHVANRIVRVAEKRHVRPRYSIGAWYVFLYFLTRVLPYSLVNWAIGKIYAK